jgi:glycosyltransferase involved in cell wall biosynthesis
LPHDYSRPVRDLLFLGGWEWRKGTRYLAQAFEKLSALYPDLRLSLAGIGAAEKEARAAFPAALQSKISVYPKLAAAETPAFYARHDLFIFPSLFESMSLVVPEAMASGLPVVTTRACGMQDIIEDGKNGFLVPVRDAEELSHKIKLLIEDRGLREKLGREAQRSARKLLWSEVASAAAALYQTVIRENNAL